MKPTSTKVGNDFGVSLPSADPNDHIAEIKRRDAIAKEAASTTATTLSQEALMAKRRAFEEANAGFFTCNFANKQFTTRCDEPNIRIVGFDKTHDEAQARLMELFMDPRVGSAPNIVPANTPFLLPYSEASAMSARHVNEKMARFFKRHADELKMREEDFKTHVAEKKPGVMEKSSYHRRKMMLEERKRRLAAGAGVGAGAGAGAGVGVAGGPSTSTGPSVSAGAGDAPAPMSAPVSRRLPEFGGMSKTTVLDPHAHQDPTITEMFTASNVGVATPAAPNVLWKGELPAHWRDAGKPRNANTWPRDLESRHGRRVVLAYLDDLDKPEDDPEFPDAAGNEPMFIIFGGEYEDDKTGTAGAKAIGEWCLDLPLDVTDMYEWLWPTLVDPDLLNEEHRTSGAGMTKEQNTIMQQRKVTMRQSAEARANSTAMGVPLKETNVNGVLDVSQVVAHTQPGMFLHGEIEQYNKDDEGKLHRVVVTQQPTVTGTASMAGGAAYLPPTTGESKEPELDGPSERLPFSLDDIPEV